MQHWYLMLNYIPRRHLMHHRNQLDVCPSLRSRLNAEACISSKVMLTLSNFFYQCKINIFVGERYSLLNWPRIYVVVVSITAISKTFGICTEMKWLLPISIIPLWSWNWCMVYSVSFTYLFFIVVHKISIVIIHGTIFALTIFIQFRVILPEF